MGASVYFFCSLLSASPFLAIVAILACYHIRRSVWRRKKRKGKGALGFCPSSAALGAVFLLITTFYRPRIEFSIEARLQEEVEEDDQGDPETPEKLFNHQLWQIRRLGRAEALVWKL